MKSQRPGATPASLHEWRKKTKYLYNAVDLLEMPDGSRPAIVGKRADRLGDWLGEEHDLVVLSEALKRDAGVMPPSVTRSLRSRHQGTPGQASSQGAAAWCKDVYASAKEDNA